jgi:hypothetical protein
MRNTNRAFLASLFLLGAWTCLATDVERLYRDFRTPPRSDSLMPYWFWNGEIAAAESRRQMQEMIAQGVHQAVVFPWGGMNLQHLSEEYWRQVGAALDAARQLGFTLTTPSATACRLSARTDLKGLCGCSRLPRRQHACHEREPAGIRSLEQVLVRQPQSAVIFHHANGILAR